MDATVRIRNPDGEWATIGTGEARGVVAENLTLSADERGPSSCGFVLKRPKDVPWGDLTAGNQVEVEVDGKVVWGGRTKQTPSSGKGSSEQITVQCEGWRAHLDDDQIDRGWVHTRLSDWRDQRTFQSVQLGNFVPDWAPTGSGGTHVLGLPYNAGSANGYASGVTLDLGPNRVARRVVVQWGQINGNAAFQLYARSHSTPNALGGSFSDGISIGHETIAAYSALTASAGTFSTGYRYVSLFFYRDDGAPLGLSGGDHLVHIASCKIFTQTRDESGNASILKASDIVKDVLTSGGLPLLDPSTVKIDATAFAIPDFWPDGYRTPGEILTAANAFHDYLLGVDAERRLFFRQRPTAPLFDTGSWSGGSFDDASLGNLDDLYNRVLVEYTGPDSERAVVARTSESSILTRQGFTRSHRLTVNAALTAAAAEQIGDVWLARHATAPLAGSITVTKGDVRRADSGAEVHPSELLTHTGERIALTDRVDPQTGAVARVGTIVNVTYNADQESAQVQLDNDTGSFEGLLSRLAVIQGAG